MTLSAVELCAGAGGQALGLHRAGFKHRALVEIDEHACATLKRNFPGTRIIRADLLKPFDASRFKGVDLLAAGVPCPPFSVAGKQLGAADERNLFPAVLNIIRDARPKAVMIENVEGLLKPRFNEYRSFIIEQFEALGYAVSIRLLDAADFGVPQRRRRGQRAAAIARRSGCPSDTSHTCHPTRDQLGRNRFAIWRADAPLQGLGADWTKHRSHLLDLTPGVATSGAWRNADRAVSGTTPSVAARRLTVRREPIMRV